MYGNNYGYYNPTRNIGVPTQPINSQFMQQPIQQSIQPVVPIGQNSLLGKVVDNIDVVKVTDIPLDGSTSYFPLTDGTAIVTKKLQADGTSKVQIYKPVEEEKEEVKELPKYVTEDDFDKKIEKLQNKMDTSDLEEEIKDLKKEIKELKTKIKEK